MPDSFDTIALFGAAGQIGSALLDALLSPSVPDYHPRVKVFYQRSESDKYSERVREHDRVERVEVRDFQDVERLAEALRGVDAVVSALNGPAISAQYALLDAADKAGVKRFLPSEFGHHHLYRAPGDKGARLHPMWDDKERFKEHLQLHPAMMSGRMSFTFVGCGDFCSSLSLGLTRHVIRVADDQPRETYWCAYAQQPPPERYVLPCVGDGDAEADFTKISDLAQYVAALLSRPSTSHNASLSFISDTLSQHRMADLLRSASGRPVDVDAFSEADAHGYIARPDEAPERCGASSGFPVEFWMMVKLAQGQGRFRRHPSQVHNALFPEVKPTPFADWLAQTVRAT
ncbi:hypothetical protein DMC30DRAFT_346165 [Rhodotorula diobovata]|uniref:NmrA-like domain-containing protein n=1 Tax=Rhodotorula diobovata TaxID=5288 RepID=A0A5C5G8D1_9BASI|nr:hypothetical protein DMC30DRAFT_346165 [Rhodotorula diobovata]